MTMLTKPMSVLGFGWVITCVLGGVVMTVSGIVALQVVGGVLLFLALASPIAFVRRKRTFRVDETPERPPSREERMRRSPGRTSSRGTVARAQEVDRNAR